MKKLLCLLMASLMVLSLAACGGAKNDDLKIGVILVGDDTEGYTKAHMDGINAAAKELGIPESNVIYRYKVGETSACSEAAQDLIAQGCKAIFSNSYGHQTYMAEVAKDYPDVTFVAMTGDFAAISGLKNFKNAFTRVYESRYVSGVIAGLKLKELIDGGKLTKAAQPKSFDENGNVRIGYVGAFPYAEVVSGYTAFYLGVKSVVSNVVMEVIYTSSWFDIDKEAAAAEALVANGAVIIGQHADSTGAPAAVQKLLNNGTICYSVGYNVDMLETAPTAALTSATNTWEVYYKHAFECLQKGTDIETDWAKGYSDSAVAITKLGPSCAAGTDAKVAETEKALKNGTLHVFDTKTFTVNGKNITTYSVNPSYIDWAAGGKEVYHGDNFEAIKDGYFDESSWRSAPYFDIRIDGITEGITIE